MLSAEVTTAGAAGLVVAFAGGALSIASPCSWPLIPGYLAYVSGVAVGETGRTRRVVGAGALFVLGFAIVFTALGATASVLGTFLLRQQPLITKVAGVFVIAMGLATLGVLRLPFLYREKRFDLNRIRSGPVGAIPLGMAFAFGWTPCIGPVLAAVFAVAANQPTASKGALLPNGGRRGCDGSVRACRRRRCRSPTSPCAWPGTGPGLPGRCRAGGPTAVPPCAVPQRSGSRLSSPGTAAGRT